MLYQKNIDFRRTRIPILALALLIGLAIWAQPTVNARSMNGDITVQFNTEPQGADVLLSGVTVGKTPWVGTVPRGTSDISVLKRGYYPVRRIVDMGAGTDGMEVRLHLRSIPSTTKITSDIPNADVYLDGKHVGRTPWASNDLMPGTHVVQVDKVGYDPVHIDFETVPGGVHEYNLNPEPRMGTLKVRIRRPNARSRHGLVYVDGKVVGWAPVVMDLLEGPHHVEVRPLQAHHAPFAEDIQIAFGETYQLPVTLANTDPNEKTADSSAWSGPNSTYVVRPGDTISRIARKQGIPASAIVHWNGLKSETLVVGQKLKIRQPPAPVLDLATFFKRSTPFIPYPDAMDAISEECRQLDGPLGTNLNHIFADVRKNRTERWISYKVHPSDTVEKIAARFGDRPEHLIGRNNIRRLKPWRRILVKAHPDKSPGVATGRPSRGRLIHGEAMPSGPYHFVRTPREAYGTSATVDLLLGTVERLNRCDPDMPPLVIGDLSLAGGGRFRPHLSHQNGQDVDLGYVPKNAAYRGSYFVANRNSLDVPRTWRLLKTLIDSGQVEYIFVNRSIQKLLYEYAKDYLTLSERARIFQYPRRRHVGMIRHSRGHDDHIHVRFLTEPRS
ncbi:MAG: hypothetical protein CMH54_02330 [Myxococcales bacterium]|nr:hypothetical protein [Myxococcales bacterium]